MHLFRQFCKCLWRCIMPISMNVKAAGLVITSKMGEGLPGPFVYMDDLLLHDR